MGLSDEDVHGLHTQTSTLRQSRMHSRDNTVPLLTLCFLLSQQDGDISIEPPVTNSGVNIQNMADLLRTGTSSQKTVILFEIPQLLTHSLPATLYIIVPAICASVKHWDEDLQIAAAEALLDVSKEKLSKETTGLIAEAALGVVSSGTVSEDIHESWGEILVRILQNSSLLNNDMTGKIIQLLESCVIDESKVRRKLAARLFGAVSPCLSTDQVEEHILEHALLLADDRDNDVRGMIAESMAFVGAATCIEVTAKRVWPTIWGLLQDSDTRIRAVTLRAISNILDSHRKKGLDVNSFSKLLYPIFIKEVSMAREVVQKDLCNIDDIAFVMLLILSQVFGEFTFSCAPHFTNDAEKDAVFQTFRCMSICNSAGIRRYCAYNLPGVALIFADRHHYQLARILEHLCYKGNTETRCILAAGIRDTVTAIAKHESGSNTIDSMFHAAMQLLQDKNPLVQISMSKSIFALLPGLGASLYTITRDARKNRCNTVFRTLSTIFADNWRAQVILATELQAEVALASSTALQLYILPLLYQLAEESPYLVRKSAMIAIAKAVWHLPQMTMRHEAMRKFRIEWAEGGVYWMRMAYIECAEAAMGCYSTKLMKELFVDTLLHLADDPVPNVRLRLGRILPNLAKFCAGSTSLKKAIDRLKMDTDVDVREAMIGIDEKLACLADDINDFEEEDLMREQAESNMEEFAIEHNNVSQRKTINLGRLKKPLSRLDLSFTNPELNKVKRSPIRQSSPRPSSRKNGLDRYTIESKDDLCIKSAEHSNDMNRDDAPKSLGRRRALSKLNISISNDIGNFASNNSKFSPRSNRVSTSESHNPLLLPSGDVESVDISVKDNSGRNSVVARSKSTRQSGKLGRGSPKKMNDLLAEESEEEGRSKGKKIPRLTSKKKQADEVEMDDLPRSLSKRKAGRPSGLQINGAVLDSIAALSVSPINSPTPAGTTCGTANVEQEETQGNTIPSRRLSLPKVDFSSGKSHLSPKKLSNGIEDSGSASFSIRKSQRQLRLPIARDSMSPINSPIADNGTEDNSAVLTPRRRSLQAMWREISKTKGKIDKSAPEK